MRKLFTLLTLVLFQCIFSQENTSTNQLSKISLSENGNFFIYDNQAYGLKHYNIIFKNEEAKSILANARANKSIGNVLGFTGGFLMGFGFIMGISGSNDPNIDQDSYKNAGWSVFGVGAGVTQHPCQPPHAWPAPADARSPVVGRRLVAVAHRYHSSPSARADPG